MAEIILLMPLAISFLCVLLPRLAGQLTAMAQLLVFVFSGLLAWRVVTTGTVTAGWFYIDAVSAFILLTLSLVTCTAAFYSAGYIKSTHGGARDQDKDLRRYQPTNYEAGFALDTNLRY